MNKPENLEMNNSAPSCFFVKGIPVKYIYEKHAYRVIEVLFYDYANCCLQKEVMPISRVAALPSSFNTQVLLPQAHEYALAFIKNPDDVSISLKYLLRYLT